MSRELPIYTRKFIVDYARQRAKLIVEKIERDVQDREIILDENENELGIKFKFFYRTSPKHRLVTNFEFACISIGDVNYMGHFMNKVWQVWKRNYLKKQDQETEAWRERTSLKGKRKHEEIDPE